MLPKLRELRLINNLIPNIPPRFLNAKPMHDNLRIFILNGNPIKEVPADIWKLKDKLKILGLASTNITELPYEISEL